MTRAGEKLYADSQVPPPRARITDRRFWIGAGVTMLVLALIVIVGGLR